MKTHLQKIREHKAATPSECKAFALCKGKVVTTIPNPILGPVPCCQKCADWYARMSA